MHYTRCYISMSRSWCDLDSYLRPPPPPSSQAAGQAAYDKLKLSLREFNDLVEAKDKQEIPIKQQECLGYVSTIEESMVKGFPFEVPARFANLPQLKVREWTGFIGAGTRFQ